MATGANQSTRAWLNTNDPNAIQIRYRAPIDPVYKTFMTVCGIIHPCSCMLCKKDEIFNSTYVQVHENRVELNYPALRLSCQCKKVEDAVQVYYYDSRWITKYDKAGVCTPCCTHCSCCPTWCGLCGEAVVFSDKCCCCCKTWFMAPFLVSADALIQQIDEAKNARPGGAPQAPGVMNMATPVVAQPMAPAPVAVAGMPPTAPMM